MTSDPRKGHSEDLFAATRMPFGDHLEELRWHLWRAVVGFGVILGLVFLLDGIGVLTDTPIGVGKPVMDFIAQPVERELQKFYDRRVEKLAKEIQAGNTVVQSADETREVPVELDVNALARALGMRDLAPGETEYVPFHIRIKPVHWTLAMHEAQRLVSRRPTLKTLSPSEGMTVYFKVAIVTGIVLGSPWIFWQIWSFVAAGLYPHEKRLVHVYLPFSLALFLAGVFLCELVVIPKAIEALLWFNEWLDFEPDLRLNEWLGFAVLMPLVFGISFQTPLVMRFLERLGIVRLDSYRRKRKLAWFLMAVFAAVITPSVDYLSMLLLWVPMGLLYELGIVLCRVASRPSEDWDVEVPEAQEVVRW